MAEENRVTTKSRTAERPQRQRTITLFGYLGGGNLGDDLMLHGFFEAAAPHSPKYLVIARDPALIELPDHVEADVFPASIGSFVRAIRHSQAIVRIGGTSFHDEYVHRGMFRRYLKLASMFLAARLSGREVYAVGVGAGAVKRISTSICARLAARSSHLIMARDPGSAALFRKFAAARKVKLGVDLASFVSRPARRKASSERVVGISVIDLAPYIERGLDQRAFWKTTSEKLLNAMGDRPRVRVFVLKENDVETDRPIADRLATDLKTAGYDCQVIGREVSSCDFIDLFSGCAAVLATRYHSAILAAALKIPMAIVPYNKKLLQFSADHAIDRRSIVSFDSRSTTELTPSVAGNPSEFEQRIDQTHRLIRQIAKGP